MGASLTFRARAWRYDGPAPWVFVTLPKAAGETIRRAFGHRTGWGSVRVEATVGDTTWATSVFPDRRSGSYVLPLKAQVRRAEGIEAGQWVAVRLAMLG